jgi:hypothetical protein
MDSLPSDQAYRLVQQAQINKQINLTIILTDHDDNDLSLIFPSKAIWPSTSGAIEEASTAPNAKGTSNLIR